MVWNLVRLGGGVYKSIFLLMALGFLIIRIGDKAVLIRVGRYVSEEDPILRWGGMLMAIPLIVLLLSWILPLRRPNGH